MIGIQPSARIGEPFTSLKGESLGSEIMDIYNGVPRKARLYQIGTPAAATAAVNRVFCQESASAKYIVTDDISAALGAATDPVVAGVFNCSRSGATLAAGDYVYLVCEGPATIATNGDDDIAKGDYIITHASTDGVCDSIAGGGTTTQTERTMRKRFGIALADDVDADNTVLAHIKCDFVI